MKKLLLILLAFHFSLFAVKAQGLWTQRASLPDTERCEGMGFAIGNYGYMGLGQDSNSKYKFISFWQFNPAINSWTKKANFPGAARIWPATFVIGHKAYLVTGSLSDPLGGCVTECWQYDATTNIWTQKANFPGSSRVYAVGFSIGGKGYVGTGSHQLTNFRKDFYSYDTTTDTWTQIADFGGGARNAACAFAMGGKGYVCFGQDSLNGLKGDMWAYDTGTNVWTQKQSDSLLVGASGFVIGNSIYVGGGEIEANDSTYYFTIKFWKYNTVLDKWTQEASIPGIAKALSSAFAVGDTGYLGMGYDDSAQCFKNLNKFYPDTLNDINEISNIIGASIFPNPTSKELFIKFASPLNEQTNFSIIDIAGRELLAYSFLFTHHQLQIDVSFLTQGLYFLSIKNKYVHLTEKFIKQ